MGVRVSLSACAEVEGGRRITSLSISGAVLTSVSIVICCLFLSDWLLVSVGLTACFGKIRSLGISGGVLASGKFLVNCFIFDKLTSGYLLWEYDDWINPKYSDRQIWANCIDPKQTPQNAASNQSLYFLPLIQQFLDTSTGCRMDIQTITKTCLYNFDPLKPHFYIVKLGFTGVYIIFLITA